MLVVAIAVTGRLKKIINDHDYRYSSMKQIEVVAAIIRKGDKIFATQRGYGEWKDWWEFPWYFRNLLLEENNELKNRYMIINPPEEWKAPTSTPTSSGQAQDKYRTSTGQVAY